MFLMDEGTLKTPIPLMSSLLVILFGVVKKNLVGYESGQKQSVKLTLGRGGGQRKGREATVHKRGRKYQHD